MVLSNHLLLFSSYLGTLLYQWLLRQSTDCETKAEYDASYQLLMNFLSMDQTVDDLGKECIEAVTKLQLSLRAKESKIGNHFRMDIRNCMDACTTSPVESANNSLKHGKYGVSSNMNMNKSVKRMLDGCNDRLARKRHKAQRDMNKKPLWSLTETGQVLIKKAEGLLIAEFDARHNLKSVQTGPTSFITWNFDSYIEDGDEKIESSVMQAYLPHFVRVRKLTIEDINGQTFVKCSCMKWKRLGNVCRCFARIVDNGKVSESLMVSPGMVDIRQWKMYAAHYGDTNENGEPTELAKRLFEAQALCVKNEDNGIPISKSLRDMIVGSPEDVYPKLGPDTTKDDYEEMIEVDDLKSCTFMQLMRLRLDQSYEREFETGEEEETRSDKLTIRELGAQGAKFDRQALTETAQLYKDNTKKAAKDVLLTEDGLTSFRGSCVTMIDSVKNCPVGSAEQKAKFEEKVREAFNEYNNDVRGKIEMQREKERKERGDNTDRSRLEVIGVGDDGRSAKKTRKRGVV